MRELIIVLSIFSSSIVMGQTAYKGGVGDGYTSTTLVLQSVGIAYHQVELIEVYPSILSVGQSFKVNTVESIDELYLIDVNGRRYTLEGNNSFMLPNHISNGLYTLWLLAGKKYHYAKLVVID